MSSHPAAKANGGGNAQDVGPEGRGGSGAIFDNVDEDLEDQRRAYADSALMGECWNPHAAGDNSTSSLSGGFTTITNMVEGAAANGGSGDQECSPSRSVFQFIEAIDTHSTSIGPRSNDSTFESYYDMQKNGPFITDTNLRQDEILKHQASGIDDDEGENDAVKDDFCEHAECGNVDSDLSTEGKSSTMSSITHDFYPKFNGKGKFTHYGKRAVSKINAHIHGSPQHHKKQESPGKEKEQQAVAKDDQSPKKAENGGGMFSSMRKRNNLVSGSPWYSMPRSQQLEPHHHRTDSTPPQDSEMQAEQKHPVDSNDQIQMEQAPSFDPLDPARIRPPKEVVIAADTLPHHNPKHCLEGVKSQDTPSIISSSSNLSQLFTNEMRERYRKGVLRSYAGRSVNTKRAIFAVVVFVCLIAIIAVTSVVMNNKNKGQVPNLSENGATVMTGTDLPSREGIPEKCCVNSYDGLDGTNNDEVEHNEDEHLDAEELENRIPPYDPVKEVEGEEEYEMHLQNASDTVPTGQGGESTQATSSSQQADNDVSSSSSGAAISKEPTKQPTEPPVKESPGEIYFAQDQITVTEVTPKPTPPPFSLPTDWGLWAIPAPTPQPSLQPTNMPSQRPTQRLTSFVAAPVTRDPTPKPSSRPSSRPTERPSTRRPTRRPTMKPNTPRPTRRPIPTPPQVRPTTTMVTIKSVDTMINESNPNKNYGLEPYLEVKGSSLVALVKFDISRLLGHSIGQATLILYSVSSGESLVRGVTHVNVHALPRAGNWDEDSATWDEDSSVMRGPFRAASFNVKADERSKHKHEIDVSVAVATLLSGARGEGPAPSSWDERYATFMLSTDSGSTVEFASREWSDGDGEPELVILLGDSLPTQKPSNKPTRKPTRKPSPSPSEAPTDEPTYEPTDHPAMSPVTETPTEAPINPTVSPSAAPTDEPSQKPTTAAPTTRPTILFQTCADGYSQGTSYSKGMRFSIIPLLGPSANSRREVYECTGSNCNDAGQVPGMLNTPQSSWTLVGTCFYVAPITKDPTPNPSASPSQRPITTSPTSDPTVAPTTPQPTTLAPTPLPTSEPTIQQTPPPSPPPSANPTPEPSPLPTEQPSPPPTTSEPTPNPTDEPTPVPTPLPTEDPTPKPSPAPTPAPVPAPTPEPSPLPTPDPTPEPSPACLATGELLAPIGCDQSSANNEPRCCSGSCWWNGEWINRCK